MALYSMIRFRLFSQQAKTHALLPGSTLACEIYPAKVIVTDLAEHAPHVVHEIVFDDFGPLNKFYVMQDLEKGEIVVSGVSAKGYIRYSLYALQAKRSFCLAFTKSPEKREPIVVGDKTSPRVVFADRERLFLGVDKAQEWSQVQRRGDMKEILPVWYWLSQSIAHHTGSTESASSLLSRAKEGTLQEMKELYQAAFASMLLPRLKDCDFQGFLLPITSDQKISPLALLFDSFAMIRRLFFQEQEGALSILPQLPAEFHCGTLAPIRTKKGHTIFLEWTKHMIRRVRIQAACDEEVSIVFQKEVKQYRLGKVTCANGATLSLVSGRTYLLDHFEK